MLRISYLKLSALTVAYSSLIIVTTVCAAPYDPQLAARIDAYLIAKGSPIAGNGSVFSFGWSHIQR